jgi:hypothetical protein
MTTADDVRELITDTQPTDWIQFNSLGAWTFRDDGDLRIESNENLAGRCEASWTYQIQSRCQSYSYIVYYGESPVEYHAIVGVDDFRAHIPMPQEPTAPNQPFTITPYQATLGRIITGDPQTFDAYLSRTGIEIVG